MNVTPVNDSPLGSPHKDKVLSVYPDARAQVDARRRQVLIRTSRKILACLPYSVFPSCNLAWQAAAEEIP